MYVTIQSGSATAGRSTAERAARRPSARRDREHEQRGRPLGEHDVLQQVRPEERVQRERLQLGGEGGEDQREAGDCSGDPEPARRLRARDERVAERERRDEPDGLRREVHPATLAAPSRV